MNTLMIQGTTSDAGKSTMVAGLCRLLNQKNISVAPFKPQNMALNSAVTENGGEIGRAQALQALAAGIKPHTDMNPVLLKPNSDTGAQIIIQGHAIENMAADQYHQYKKIAQQAVLESYHRLKKQYDIILVEGAGSPAEINLRENDIANMGFAEAVDCPVWIVADIDRGGVFAHLTGTLALLSKSEQERVNGFIINRFRGDYSLLKPGIDWLENYSSVKTVGTIPYLHGLHLEAEDALSQNQSMASENNAINIIVPLLPHISNHTDFDPLLLHPQVNLTFVSHEQKIPAADLIILPGSKNVAFDLEWLKSQHWDQVIAKHLRYGGKVMGICGGFQMLGKEILDPMQLESSTTQSKGLGLLDISTTLQAKKQLRNVSGTLSIGNAPVFGYEIHTGISTGEGLKRPAIFFEHTNDGAISKDQQIMGTYLHGLFETDLACQSLLQWSGLKQAKHINYHDQREKNIDRLAASMEKHLNMNWLFKTLGL